MAEYSTHRSAWHLDDTLLFRAQGGCRTSLDQLLGCHEGLIHAVIRREGSSWLTYEEALQAGRIGLWRAILGYDPARGTAFSTYAWVAIRRHIHRAARQAAGDRQCWLMAHPSHQAADGWGELAQELETSLDRALVHQALFTLLSQLPDRLRQVITARYGLDGQPPRSLRQLGIQLGLSHERIRQLEQEALAWLRHPAHSLLLRQLLDKNTAAHYRQARALNAALRRARRRRR